MQPGCKMQQHPLTDGVVPKGNVVQHIILALFWFKYIGLLSNSTVSIRYMWVQSRLP